MRSQRRRDFSVNSVLSVHAHLSQKSPLTTANHRQSSDTKQPLNTARTTTPRKKGRQLESIQHASDEDDNDDDDDDDDDDDADDVPRSRPPPITPNNNSQTTT